MSKLLYFCLVGLVLGRPNFRELIPNGLRVPCPEGQEDNCANEICQGVGHLSCAGGGERNLFGQDFQAGGYVWSKDFCQADSDGDGIPNGVELGDPCCTWKQGDDSPDVEVSHPGFANSVLQLPQEAAQCDDTSLPASEDAAAVAVSASSISYFESEGDDLYVFEYRMDEHDIPSIKNSYYNVRFNFPVNQTYDIVGMEPIVDNAPVLHHYVTQACDTDTDDEGLPVEQESEANVMTDCRDNFYNWAVGGELIVFPSNAGFRIGKGTDRKSFNINVHYNNALEKSGLKDASGVRFFATTKLRDVEIGSFQLGGLINLGEIPAGKESYYSTTICEISVDKNVAPDGAELFGWLPHAHGIGKAIFVEKIKRIEDLDGTEDVLFQNDEYAQIGFLSEERNFDYNDQRQLLYPAGMKIYDGDILATTCIYDSTSRTVSTYGGQKTEDEMCIAGQMFTPREAIVSSRQCAFGNRYNGEFPAGAKSVFEVTLVEPFDYEQAFKDELLTCDQNNSQVVSDVCEDFESQSGTDLFVGSPGYQCSTECALFLYRMIGCDQFSGISAIRMLMQSGALSNITGSGGLPNLGGNLQGGLLSNLMGNSQAGLLNNQGGNPQGGLLSGPRGNPQGGLLSGLSGNSEGGLLSGSGGDSQAQNSQQQLLQLFRNNPSLLIPISCTNIMEDYVEQQKVIKEIEQVAGCKEDSLPVDLEKAFQDSCGYVVETGTCSKDCATFVSTIYKCQSEGVAGVEDIAQIVQEQVGAECSQVIAAFQV